jgi:DNA polymerase-3 subunit epsilon
MLPGTAKTSEGELRMLKQHSDAELDVAGEFRLLRRLDVREGETGVGGRVNTTIGVVVDVETSGLGADDVIVELALRRFRCDPDGLIVKIDRSYSWLEDPGRELPADIVRLTGITDADLAGQAIDDDAVVRLLSSATERTAPATTSTRSLPCWRTSCQAGGQRCLRCWPPPVRPAGASGPSAPPSS